MLLAAAGAGLLAGRELPGLGLRLRHGPAVTRSLPSMALFGAADAIASLGCTIGPFIAIVVSSFRAGSLGAGVGLFVAYSAGMGLVVGTVALAVALARASLVGRLRRAAPALSRSGGLLLLVAGGYVAYYGWYEIRVLRGGAPDDAAVAAADDVQRWSAGGLDRLGVPGVAALFAVLFGGALAVAPLRRRRRHTSTEPGVPGAPRACIPRPPAALHERPCLQSLNVLRRRQQPTPGAF